ELGRCRRPVHDLTHREARLVETQRAALDDARQGVVDVLGHGATSAASSARRVESPSPAWRRKLANRCGPCGVSTLSGWNWTPSRGSATWRMPMITRSASLIAVTRND